MDFQARMSEFLAAVVIVLIVMSVAVPISVLIMQQAGQRFKKRRSNSRQRQLDVPALWRVDALLRRFRLRPRRIGARVDPAPVRQRRCVHRRLRTCLLGSVHTEAVTRVDNLCDVVDFSASGARIRLVDPMAEIAHLTLGLRHFGFFPGRVVWRNGEELGLQFDLTPEAVVSQMRGLLPQASAAGAY